MFELILLLRLQVLPLTTLIQFSFTNVMGSPSEILASMPDPMRPYLLQIVFVMVLVTIMYIYLRLVFFKPLTQMMSNRSAEIQKGFDTKQIAAQKIANEQKKYQEQMKALRAKAFDRKKELSSLANLEKNQLIEQAQREVALLRSQARKTIEQSSSEARKSLDGEIQSLADAMVRQILPKGTR